MILITEDLFDIAWRLRAVNDDYRLYYNGRLRRYEVHSASRGSMQFALPFDELDARAVDYARYTAVQNADRLLREVEEHNARLDRRLACDIAERAGSVTSEMRRKNES